MNWFWDYTRAGLTMNRNVFFGVLLTCTTVHGAIKLQEQYKWSAMDYAFPNDQVRAAAINSGDYIPSNNLPVGIEIWKDKLFITVPRWKPGVPSTLNYIPLSETTPPSPPLIPFPDWKTNEFGNCESGLTNVYRIKADSCNRLWVLDTGTFGIGNTTNHICPYTLNIFDLRSRQLLRRYPLRPEDLTPQSFIANIAVDEGASCEEAFAYMSDELGYGLIAYSWELNRSWRFNHGFFRPDPLAGDFHIGGLSFQWSDEGIFGMALTPMQPDGFRTLFFSPLASNREFAVSTKVLRDPLKAPVSYYDFIALPERGPNARITAKAMNEHGIQFFNLIDLNALGCWNSKNPYQANFLAIADKDDVGMIFPSDVKIDDQENVWVMSDRMPIFLMSTLDYTDINFRIYFAPVKVLVQGTVCDEKAHGLFGSIGDPLNTPLFQNKNYIF